jgi:Fic family protein
LLRAVTEKNAWEPWLLYMLDAVEQTALFTKERIVAIRSLMEKTIAVAKEKLPARAYRKDLIELIFHQPYTKVQAVVDADIVERQTAAEYLKELEKIGILKSQERPCT